MSNQTYVVTAPLVVFRNTDGTDLYVYRGGPVPESADPEHVKALIKRGMLGKAATPKAQDPDPATYTDGDDPGDFTIAQVETYVGADAGRAAAVRDLEKARGDKSRSSLIEKLDAVIAADTPGQ